eukprot:GEMP01045417.1.p1 GENE.GEMP01045417.1~~GEMP01045417.1.p1  ORF type:complete len:446 (+),score=71.53 GEMP01045417.1:129-1466(+)
MILFLSALSSGVGFGVVFAAQAVHPDCVQVIVGISREQQVNVTQIQEATWQKCRCSTNIAEIPDKWCGRGQVCLGVGFFGSRDCAHPNAVVASHDGGSVVSDHASFVGSALSDPLKVRSLNNRTVKEFWNPASKIWHRDCMMLSSLDVLLDVATLLVLEHRRECNCGQEQCQEGQVCVAGAEELDPPRCVFPMLSDCVSFEKAISRSEDLDMDAVVKDYSGACRCEGWSVCREGYVCERGGECVFPHTITPLWDNRTTAQSEFARYQNTVDITDANNEDAADTTDKDTTERCVAQCQGACSARLCEDQCSTRACRDACNDEAKMCTLLPYGSPWLPPEFLAGQAFRWCKFIAQSFFKPWMTGKAGFPRIVDYFDSSKLLVADLPATSSQALSHPDSAWISWWNDEGKEKCANEDPRLCETDCAAWCSKTCSCQLLQSRNTSMVHC